MCHPDTISNLFVPDSIPSCMPAEPTQHTHLCYAQLLNMSPFCRPTLWQNRPNYSGSSALVIAIQPILTQYTSNGTTHWSDGSLPDATTVQQDRSRFTSHEGEFTITHSSPTFNYRILNIITNHFKLRSTYTNIV
jgi:hypothetical protein